LNFNCTADALKNHERANAFNLVCVRDLQTLDFVANMFL